MIQVLLFFALIPFNKAIFRMLKEAFFLDQGEYVQARQQLLSKNFIKHKGYIYKEDLKMEVKLSIFYLVCISILLVEFVLLYDVVKRFF